MSKERLRAKFMRDVQEIVKYWTEEPDIKMEVRVEGVAFSILTMIDGVSVGVDPVDLTIKDIVINDDVMLHELFHK